MSENCVFCKIVAGTIASEILWQDEQVFAIQDIAPRAPVHLLVLPKQHLSTMLEVDDAATALSMFTAVQALKSSHAAQYAGFNIVVNNGKAAGQIIEHLHWHFLAGKNLYDGQLTL